MKILKWWERERASDRETSFVLAQLDKIQHAHWDITSFLEDTLLTQWCLYQSNRKQKGNNE